VIASFKLKLVAYFMLLSLLPLAAAFWGFSTVAKRSEARRVDARMQGGLRAALAAYDEELSSAARAAENLANNRQFQESLARRDATALRRELHGARNLRVVGRRGFHVGSQAPLAAERQVLVLGRSGLLGRVIASVRLDAGLVRRLHARSGLPSGDRMVLVVNGRIAVGDGWLQGPLGAQPGRTGTVDVAGERYRALVADRLQEQRSAAFAVLSPQAAIDNANEGAQRRLLLGLLGALLLIALVAYVEGRSIVRTVSQLVDAAHAIARGRFNERVPVRGRDELAQLATAFNDMAGQLEARLEELASQRGRLREAVTRFGEALAATHDPDQLLRVIVETAVEATGATGGVLLTDRGPIAEGGNRLDGPDTLQIPLHAGSVDFGTLVLFGDDFGEEESMTANSLAAQAVVALDNARLHRIVERQALVDGLTGLANRRQCEEALEAELSRAARFGTPLALAVGDLDDFKDVNDRFGHSVGDTVLREFAAVLRDEVREIDLAARWGGEEFVLLLPGTDAEGGAKLADRVRGALERRPILTPEGTPIHVTASFGVAAFPESGPSSLFQSADAAMYEAKRTGKNRVTRATPRHGVRASG
jgi:diguanylate cyclase (GGDEF)-like protein